ncbi:MAG: hypothetical protein MUF13_06820 [Akkermansiaceae bacterium]|jgi:hypothetical protein|nr:hypothetical protein [Akkermansiaceae bacterium]
MILRLPLLFLVAILLHISTRPVQGADKPGKSIALRLLACEVTQDPPKVYLETTGGKSDEFDLPSSAFTAPIEVSHREVVLKAPGNDVPMSDIIIPDQGRTFAVLLAPKDPEGFTPTVLRLDDNSFKPGDYHFVNLSKETLVLKLGDTEVVVEAGASVKSRPSGPLGSGFCKVIMSTRSESGDKIFASTRWLMANPKRGYVIFTARSNGKITYRAVDE